MQSRLTLRRAAPCTPRRGKLHRRGLALLIRAVAAPSRIAPLPVRIKQASQQDFWAAAEVHAASFCRKEAPLSYQVAKIARFNDIVRSSDANFVRTHSLAGLQGRYVCLVAQGGSSEAEASAEKQPALVTTVLRSLYPTEFHAGFVQSAEEGGIYGAMNLDTTGRFIPTLSLLENGRVRRKRPQGCAYFSNLSVLPSARRRGIGGSLIEEAERLAAEWGCWGAALHCSRDNIGAYGLYYKHGYRYVEGAAQDKHGCIFLAKVF